MLSLSFILHSSVSPFQLMHVEEKTGETVGMECVFNVAGTCVNACVCVWQHKCTGPLV